MTFVGPFTVLFCDILNYTKNILTIFADLYDGARGKRKLDDKFDKIIVSISGINFTQWKGMEDQRKITQMFFEEIPLLIL